MWLRCRCLSNAASARSTGLPLNSGCLHCPQSGALASWSARTRLVVWQWGQTMCRDLLIRFSWWLVRWNARLAGLPCLTQGQLQFLHSYFYSCLHPYSLALRPKTKGRYRPKMAFQGIFKPAISPPRSFSVKNRPITPSKVATNQ